MKASYCTYVQAKTTTVTKIMPSSATTTMRVVAVVWSMPDPVDITRRFRIRREISVHETAMANEHSMTTVDLRPSVTSLMGMSQACRLHPEQRDR